MSSVRQKILAEKIIKNMKAKKPLNKSQLVESSGYTAEQARAKSGEIIESLGVKAELKVLGFDEYSAKKVVESIMNNEDVDPNARLKASDQVFKVTGAYAPEKNINMNLNFTVSDEDKKRLDDILNDNGE